MSIKVVVIRVQPGGDSRQRAIADAFIDIETFPSNVSDNAGNIYQRTAQNEACEVWLTHERNRPSKITMQWTSGAIDSRPIP